MLYTKKKGFFGLTGYAFLFLHNLVHGFWIANLCAIFCNPNAFPTRDFNAMSTVRNINQLNLQVCVGDSVCLLPNRKTSFTNH